MGLKGQPGPGGPQGPLGEKGPVGNEVSSNFLLVLHFIFKLLYGRRCNDPSFSYREKMESSESWEILDPKD